jgi:hypothetical protein
MQQPPPWRVVYRYSGARSRAPSCRPARNAGCGCGVERRRVASRRCRLDVRSGCFAVERLPPCRQLAGLVAVAASWRANSTARLQRAHQATQLCHDHLELRCRDEQHARNNRRGRHTDRHINERARAATHAWRLKQLAERAWPLQARPAVAVEKGHENGGSDQCERADEQRDVHPACGGVERCAARAEVLCVQGSGERNPVGVGLRCNDARILRRARASEQRESTHVSERHCVQHHVHMRGSSRTHHVLAQP